MNKRFTDRLLALLLAWWLLASFAIPVTWAEPGDTVTISTTEDLLRFAKSCALDTWSQGKTVVLAADLELAAEEFTPIPTFGGTFLGQGHTISGLRITSAGSVQGLFRYIQPSGTVQDLTVQGTVVPEGTRSTVGGIVGDNAGVLQDCAFQGTVQGDSSVGGIAGRNSAAGQIIRCTSSGSVSGDNAAGGIAGRNLGLLLKCENRAGVNLTQTESSIDLLDAGAGAALEERAAADDETYHLLSSGFDTGGIVGYSSGVVQSCTNYGTVGYPHVGYNTGGIAGRQSGYLAGCVNSGTVYGRKDVGGIVGQAEPYLLVDPGEDTLNRLRTELDTLDRFINRALDNAQRTGDSVYDRLEVMSGFTDDARDSSQRLLNRVGDFADENVETINLLSADITSALDKISPALDDLSDAGGQLERLSVRLERAMDDLGDAVNTGDQVMRDLRSAVSSLREAASGLTSAAGSMEAALDAFHRFLSPGDWEFSWAALDEARAALRQAFRTLQGAGDGLDSALSQLQTALNRSGALSGHLGDALEEFEDAASSSAAIGRLMRRSLDTIGDAVDLLTADGPAEFTPLGDDFRQASGGLFDALSGLSNEMEGLRSTIQSGGDTLASDLRAISRQFNVVFDVLLDALIELRGDAEDGFDDRIQDTSEEDIAATREGKIADCRSTGTVEGDRNVGGIVGAMAIEFDLDPEDDQADRFSFGATYETKAVLQSCLNYGSVTAKKDGVGGLAGRMDLGTALDCQNYGSVASTGGNYVGGVAGFADASIRSCFAKNTLSGKNYVGGIAGWASRLQECYAIPTITEGSECLGAVAGGVAANGVLQDNRFVDTGTAGVDGVSYAGRAEPIPFDELSQLPGIPPEFTGFTLTLLAGEETVAQIPFLYGEDLSRVQLPPVPEVEGCYGLWPEFDRSGLRSDLTVEAEYAPWVTLVASDAQKGRLSVALAEGVFTGEAELLVTASTSPPPQEAGEEAELWDITLTGTGLTGEDPVPLRLLSPGGGGAKVWQYQNGQWQPVEAQQNGQYLLLSMTGPQGTFCVQPLAETPWGLAAAAVGAAVLAVLLLVFLRKRKKAAVVKAAAPKEQDSAAKD